MNQNDADKSLFSLAQIQHLMRVEFNRAQRYGYAISCLIIAVDRLGHLRDMYGYDYRIDGTRVTEDRSRSPALRNG